MELTDKTREEFAEKHIRKLYSKVVKKFPNIKKDSISVEYIPDYDYAGMSICDCDRLLIKCEFVVKTTLNVGRNFLRFSKEEQEAVIAHELGHYEHDTKGTPEVLKRRTLWATATGLYHHIDNPAVLATLEGLRYIKTEPVKRILYFFNKESKLARLQKWNQMCDLDADQQSI